MSSSQVFLLDSNVLMTAARQYYAFDIAPCFWTSLSHHAGNGELRSIDRVRDEINRGNDELVVWTNFFLASTWDIPLPSRISCSPCENLIFT